MEIFDHLLGKNWLGSGIQRSSIEVGTEVFVVGVQLDTQPRECTMK